MTCGASSQHAPHGVQTGARAHGRQTGAQGKMKKTVISAKTETQAFDFAGFYLSST
jgi:hypothetical protein